MENVVILRDHDNGILNGAIYVENWDTRFRIVLQQYRGVQPTYYQGLLDHLKNAGYKVRYLDSFEVIDH